MAAITLKQIRERHFGRSPSHIRQLIQTSGFPPPLNTGELGGPSLWDEDAVKGWVAAFIEAAKARGPGDNRERVAAALAARAQRAKTRGKQPSVEKRRPAKAPTRQQAPLE